jgi:exodeoxyribonuclease VII large subunit
VVLTPPERAPEGRPYSVSELLRLLRRAVETALPRAVAVSGEIVNYTQHGSSGHSYFALRDPGGMLRCVMFRTASQFLRFRPTDGLLVEAQGLVTFYAPQGQIQLAVDSLAPAGRGALIAALDLLKEKLAAEGLFAVERKRRLPRFPRAVGLVTSPSGAAFHDLVHVIRRRAPWVTIYLAPARVQGEGAGLEVARAIQRLNRHGECDVLIVGRGGGAREDLWTFNEEGVVRAIVTSRAPVVSAVGHESDMTLSDLAADARAATPSHAAELAVPQAAAVRQLFLASERRLARALLAELRHRQAKLNRLSESYGLREPKLKLEAQRERLRGLARRLERGLRERHRIAAGRAGAVEGRLQALGPSQVLRRGYALVRRPDGALVTRAAALAPADRLRLEFADGRALSEVTRVEVDGDGEHREAHATNGGRQSGTEP